MQANMIGRVFQEVQQKKTRKSLKHLLKSCETFNDADKSSSRENVCRHSGKLRIDTRAHTRAVGARPNKNGDLFIGIGE